jgi:hypothetical protein
VTRTWNSVEILVWIWEAAMTTQFGFKLFMKTVLDQASLFNVLSCAENLINVAWSSKENKRSRVYTLLKRGKSAQRVSVYHTLTWKLHSIHLPSFLLFACDFFALICVSICICIHLLTAFFFCF